MYRYRFMYREDLEQFIRENLMPMEEARLILDVSTQYFSDIVKAGKLTPAISHNKYKLYWKEDILEFQRKREEKKKKKSE